MAASCTACGEGSLKAIAPFGVPWAPGVRALVGCPACGFARPDPLPTEADLDRLYDEGLYRLQGGYEDYERRQAPIHRGLLARALDAAPPPRGSGPRAVLDVGCGVGLLLEQACSLGLQPWGVERSSRDAALARERLRVGPDRVLVGEADADDGPLAALAARRAGAFDLIAVVDVLEHLRRPDRLAAHVAALLREEGIALVVTGNAASRAALRQGPRWDYYRREGHLAFFTPAALRRLAERAGLRVHALETSLAPTRHDRGLHRMGLPVSRLRSLFNRTPLLARAKTLVKRIAAGESGEGMLALLRRPALAAGA